MHNVDIVNCSLSTLPGETPNKMVEDGIKKLLNDNKILIVAAGNCGPLINTINTLSGIRGVITVGSSNIKGDRLTNFSSRGVPNTELKPTVITYGEDLFYKLDKKNTYNYSPEEIQVQISFRTGRKVEISKEEAKYYAKLSGTSFSTAAVSGYIAKLLDMRKALHLEWSPIIIKEILEDMAIPMLDYKEHEVGRGFIDYETIKKYFKNIDSLLFPNYYWGKMWIDADGGGLSISNYLTAEEIFKIYQKI